MPEDERGSDEVEHLIRTAGRIFRQSMTLAAIGSTAEMSARCAAPGGTPPTVATRGARRIGRKDDDLVHPKTQCAEDYYLIDSVN